MEKKKKKNPKQVKDEQIHSSYGVRIQVKRKIFTYGLRPIK